MKPLTLEADLPPSARYCAHVLQEEGPLTHSEFIELTKLPESTVDDALARLIDEGLVNPSQRLFDSRGREYRLDRSTQ